MGLNESFSTVSTGPTPDTVAAVTYAPPPDTGGTVPNPPTPAPPPPPPPPPPSLMAPPGGATASHGPVGTAALQRVGKLASATVALAGVTAALSVVSIWASRAARDDARDLLDDTITTEEFVERAAPYLLMSVVQAVATATTAVLTMIWMFRIARNHRALHRGGTWGPGWAVGGWFLPPLLFVIPALMFRELWKASDPDVAVGGGWRTNPTSPLIPLWFVLYSLLPLGLLIGQSAGGLSLGATENDMAQQVLDGQNMTVVSAAVSVAGAVVYILLVRGLTDRHCRLTGESRA